MTVISCGSYVPLRIVPESENLTKFNSCPRDSEVSINVYHDPSMVPESGRECTRFQSNGATCVMQRVDDNLRDAFVRQFLRSKSGPAVVQRQYAYPFALERWE